MKRYEDCGVNQQTFCQQHDIALSTFYRWRKKLKQQSGPDDNQPTEQSPFIALAPPEVEAQSSNDWDVELAFANGMTIRLRT